MLPFHPHYRILATPASFGHSACLGRSPHICINVWIATLLTAFLPPTPVTKNLDQITWQMAPSLHNPSITYLHLQHSLGSNRLIQYITPEQYCYCKMHKEIYRLHPQPTSKHSRHSQRSGICTAWQGLEVDSWHIFIRYFESTAFYMQLSVTCSTSAWRILSFKVCHAGRVTPQKKKVKKKSNTKAAGIFPSSAFL